MNTSEHIIYDTENDVLYVKIADQSNSYGTEVEPGFVVMRNMDDDAVTGITFIGVMRYTIQKTGRFKG